jgi:phosphatidylinositol alpha-1,6-mannosyltransferase
VGRGDGQVASALARASSSIIRSVTTGARNAREIVQSLRQPVERRRSLVSSTTNIEHSRGRVVVLAKAFPPTLGGVETYSEQVVRAYLRADYAVSVLTQTAGAAGWARRDSEDGVFDLFSTGSGGQAAVSRRLWSAARLLKRRSSDLIGVHSTTWRPGVVGQSVFPGLPRVITVHGREVLNYPRGTGAVMRFVLNKATRVLAVSTATRSIGVEAARPTRLAQWVVSYNGLTHAERAASFERIEHDGPLRILSLCRLVPRKNVRRAVAAVATLPPQLRDNIDFRIAGRGPESDSIAAEIARLNLGRVVALTGFVAEDDVSRLYDWADIFVHPQSHVGQGVDFEGFGIAIADAMAHGCAVIAGRDGGPADFVKDGVTGLLVDGNETAAISDALGRLLGDAELRGRLASAGRDFAFNSFSWDRHIEPALAVFTADAGVAV